jgi:hypothetical protein
MAITMTALAINKTESINHIKYASDTIDLADIYDQFVNLVVWQRQLNAAITEDVSALLNTHTSFAFRAVLKPSEVHEWLRGSLKQQAYTALENDIASIAEIFADLFDLSHVGLRLELLNKTMCPRFHVDKLMCRLVSTYAGNTTQWLTEDNVDRTKLGAGANGLPDETSGIYINEEAIQQASPGDVLLMKGQAWPNSSLPALVHRSPSASALSPRLLLGIDFA